jgi:hypothetical protein
MTAERSLREQRAAAQLLAGAGARSLDRAVRRLLAVPAQDSRTPRLALRARKRGLAAADVDRALTDERSLVVAWLCRGTLHLTHADDYPWLLGLTAPGRMRSNARRLGEEGVTPDAAERAMQTIRQGLADEGPLTRAELGDRIAAAGVRTEGQALPHLLMQASLRGMALLGPVRERAQAFVLTRDWLGDVVRADGPGRPAGPPGGDLAPALAELARRYLTSHGPASAADLAAWAGLPVRAARAGLRAIARELVEEDGLVALARRRSPRGRVHPKLLPAFDPYMLGWKQRAFAVPEAHAKRVHPGGGIVRAVMLVDASAAGTWTARRRAGEWEIGLEPFGRIDPQAEAALLHEAEDVERFLAADD